MIHRDPCGPGCKRNHGKEEQHKGQFEAVAESRKFVQDRYTCWSAKCKYKYVPMRWWHPRNQTNIKRDLDSNEPSQPTASIALSQTNLKPPNDCPNKRIPHHPRPNQDERSPLSSTPPTRPPSRTAPPARLPPNERAHTTHTINTTDTLAQPNRTNQQKRCPLTLPGQDISTNGKAKLGKAMSTDHSQDISYNDVH